MSKGLIKKMTEIKGEQLSFLDEVDRQLAQQDKQKKDDAKRYISAGKAVFTLETTKYDEGYTYKFVHDKKDKCVYRFKVYRMFGNDNENDYTFIGLYYSDTGTYKSKADKANKPMYDRLIAAFLRMIHSDTEQWYNTCKFYKSKLCAVCGRRLTTPESIERGIGPECYTKLKGV